MLRESAEWYAARWVERSQTEFKTRPHPEFINAGYRSWETMVEAAYNSRYERLLESARAAGKVQSIAGISYPDAARRTIEMTNLIELAVANTLGVPPTPLFRELVELRTLVSTAILEGYSSVHAEAKVPRPKLVLPPSSEKRDAIERAVRRKRHTQLLLRKGEHLEPNREPDSRFYFVESGVLRLYATHSDGRSLTLSILSANELFLRCVGAQTALVSLGGEAMQDTTLLVFSEQTLGDVLAASPEAVAEFASSFGRRLNESHLLIEDLLNKSVDLRLCRALFELSETVKLGDRTVRRVNQPLTHKRLAEMVGANRVTVTRKLSELRELGIIDVHRNASSIVILDVERLGEVFRNGSLS
jgi:CRP/FNR family transcriptional regulator